MPYSRERRAHFYIDDAIRELQLACGFLDGKNTKPLREEVEQCEAVLTRISAAVELEADHFDACGDCVELR